MTLEELENLVSAREGGMIEFKETTGQKILAMKTLCASLLSTIDTGIGRSRRTS